MIVEIWSDVVCPWCYIGKRRFEKALAQFDQADEVEIVWRSFQLNPDQPKGERMPQEQLLAAKYGRSIEQVREMNAHVTAMAAAEGLEYDLGSYKVVNTFDAHRLTHLAKEHGLNAELNERLLRAQLVEGEVLEDPDTLVRVAAEVGIPEAESRRVLDSDEFTAEVEHDINEARALGISGVPFFVIDRRYGVSGAQPPEMFLQALETAAHAAASTS